jgi:hypothetical protein
VCSPKDKRREAFRDGAESDIGACHHNKITGG